MSSSKEQVGYELSQGSLWVRMSNGRYWKLRRNGKTKVWKRNPWRYRIPVKAGLHAFTAITNETEIGTFDSNANIICAHENDIRQRQTMR